MKAILWDGQKQIKGELILEKACLKFNLRDFSETSLRLTINYIDIKEIAYHKIYNLEPQGLEIMSEHEKNIFIVEEPQKVKTNIESLLKEQPYI